MMKKTKIVLCAILAAVLLFYAGCGNQSQQEDTKAWAASSAGTKKQTSEPAYTRSEELSTLAEIEVDGASITLPMGITAADIEQLETMLWANFFNWNYNSEEAAFLDAMPYVVDYSVPWGLQFVYDVLDPNHIHGEYTTLSVVDEPDPREQFFDMYYKVDASVVDFLIADVLHCTPDHKVRNEMFYCEGDYYYFDSVITGLEGYDTVIRACQLLDNGHYRITAELLSVDPGNEPEHEASAFLEMSMAQTDGLRHWTIYSIETFE